MSNHEENLTAAVVFESMFGNCEKVARQIAAGMATGVPVKVVDVADAVADPSILDDVALVVAGGPTHSMSMSRPGTRAEAVQRSGGTVPARNVGLREWCVALQDRTDEHGPRWVTTFDTRTALGRAIPSSASRAAARIVTRKGYEMLVPLRSFLVEDAAGPLVDGHLEEAYVWGEKIAAALRAQVPVAV
ncbi:flavodoxin domain-containing protein [Oerskovia sp. NPDC057915]|uniref:flavodoxin domain-containing protein n=1 Tax=Oerskovia sp. NPDC057915 TaxID=3346280 RepID=UPI0036DB0A04